MHPTETAALTAAITAGTATVRRNTRCYDIGHNPNGGRYIAVQYGPRARDIDTIDERAVRHAGGRYPADGGPGSRWQQLCAALDGVSPWDATDAQILAAWPTA